MNNARYLEVKLALRGI